MSTSTESPTQTKVDTNTQPTGKTLANSATEEKKAEPRQKIDVYSLSYTDRHIVKHLRHEVDKDIEKRAWEYCDDFSKQLLRCQRDQGFLYPVKCQAELKELKVCMNRFIVEYRESHPQIMEPPSPGGLLRPTAPEYVTYRTISDSMICCSVDRTSCRIVEEINTD